MFTELRNPGIECGLGEYVVVLFSFVHAEFVILLKGFTHTFTLTEYLESSLYQEMLPMGLLGVLSI